MIKTKVIKALTKVDGTFTRQDIQKQIWVAQGNKLETYVLRQGYYADALQEWVAQNLIQREDKGLYSMTNEGRLFATNRKEWLKKRREARKSKYEAQQVAKRHTTDFNYLIGKKIVNVRRLTPNEVAMQGWNDCPLVIEFDDKTCIIPMRDDEGNDGGAMLFYDYNKRKSDTIYVI